MVPPRVTGVVLRSCAVVPTKVCCPAPSRASHDGLFLSPVHQSPVSSLQFLCHDPQPEPADGTRLSTYCPDYTVRALSDLQFIKVRLLIGSGL